MNWKYFIPHVWERERVVWEDVYLLPMDDRYDGQALWLTVDALGNADNPEHGSDRAGFQAEALEKLGDRPFHIDETGMVVRAQDFSLAELLAWVRIWLEEQGLPAGTLIEGSAAEFRGKAFHADLLDRLKQQES